MEYPIENQPTPLARQDELVVQELPDEVLVYDLTKHTAHCLNKTAAFIWEQCDGQNSVSELARLTKEEFQVPIDESIVWQTLDRLSKANLLTAQIKSPVDERLRSRRMILGKLGTAAMLSIPLVTTIIAPMAAQAATCLSECTAGSNCSPCAQGGQLTDCGNKKCRFNTQGNSGYNCTGNSSTNFCCCPGDPPGSCISSSDPICAGR